MKIFEIRGQEEQEMLVSFVKEMGGSESIRTGGKTFNLRNLRAYMSAERKSVAGILAFAHDFETDDCQIIAFYSRFRNHGLGSELLDAMIQKAIQLECARLNVFLTNDQTRTLRFFQRRGFQICDLRLNSVDEARELDPKIPLYGEDSIEMRHELGLEMVLRF